MSYERPIMGHGNMKPLSDEDEIRDNNGFTHPNLHRRIDASQPEGEIKPRDYSLFVNGVNSYRLTESYIYEDEDNPNEIP